MNEQSENLTAKQLRSILHFDYDTGKFYTHRSDLRRTIGSVTAYGYMTIQILGTNYMAHRLAWLYDKGAWPKGQIDHINGDKLDNRIENLRDVDQTTNMQNQSVLTSNNALGLKGAYFHKKTGKFYSQIRVDGKLLQLGNFKTAEDAHAAYIAAKQKYHKGFIFR